MSTWTSLETLAAQGVSVSRSLPDEGVRMRPPTKGRPAPEPQQARHAHAHIYKPARSVTQAGRANTRHWILECERRRPPFREPLMGWTGSDDPLGQVRIRFPTKEQAIAFAARRGWTWTVHEPKARPAPHPAPTHPGCKEAA